jgi:hypothetical protein
MLAVALDWFLIGVLKLLCLSVHSSLARSIYSLCLLVVPLFAWLALG